MKQKGESPWRIETGVPRQPKMVGYSSGKDPNQAHPNQGNTGLGKPVFHAQIFNTFISVIVYSLLLCL